MDEWTPMYDAQDAKDPKTDVGYYRNICEGTYWNKKQLTSLSCLDWPTMINTPVSIPLPAIIYFEPSKVAKSLPTGKLWGILMSFTVFGPTRRPRGDGVVFVPWDQSNDLSRDMYEYSKLYEWALDEKNCPSSMRFHSLSTAIRTLCVGESAPFLVPCAKKTGHFQALKCWKELEWGITIEGLINLNTAFIEIDSLPIGLVPNPPPKKRRKRKKPVGNSTEKFMETFDWKKLNLDVTS